MRLRATPGRLAFRVLLAVALVWSAWPTVAGAFDGPGPDAGRPVSARPPAPPSSDVSTTTSSTSTLPPAPSTTAAPVPTSVPVDTSPPVAPPSTAPAPLPPPPSTQPMTAPPTVAPAPNVEAFALPAYCDGSGADLITVTNRDRRAAGLAPLCPNSRLGHLAQQWADHLAATSTFVHQDLWSAIDTTPFYAMAENILRAPGPITIDQMEVLWMNSPEHRKNILNPSYVAVGVGIARTAQGVTYAVVEFGGMPR